jgi:hypothetical protein
VGTADHFKERIRLGLVINLPIGVKNLVPAVLRVDLRKHEKLNIGRISSGERVRQIVNLGLIKCKTKRLVSLRETIARNMDKRFGLVVGKQVIVGRNGIRDDL